MKAQAVEGYSEAHRRPYPLAFVLLELRRNGVDSANDRQSRRCQGSASAGPMFMGLGDLLGGLFQSRANAVSADGSMVVGEGDTASGIEAFRWDATNGMVGLDDLAGGQFHSEAFGVSAVEAPRTPDQSHFVTVGGRERARRIGVRLVFPGRDIEPVTAVVQSRDLSR